MKSVERERERDVCAVVESRGQGIFLTDVK